MVGTARTAPLPTLHPSAATTPNAQPAIATKPNPWYPDHALLSTTKDELKAMPEFTYSD